MFCRDLANLPIGFVPSHINLPLIYQYCIYPAIKKLFNLIIKKITETPLIPQY